MGENSVAWHHASLLYYKILLYIYIINIYTTIQWYRLHTLKNLSNDIWHAYQSRKLVSDEENNIPPPLH